MQTLHGSPAIEARNPLALLFDRTAVARNLSAFTGLDRRLQPLLEYRQFDYWVYEHHRNLIQLVVHVKDAAARLDSRHPIHQALFLDLAWLYLLTLILLTEHLQSAFLGDADRGLQAYLVRWSRRIARKQGNRRSRLSRREGQTEGLPG